MRYLLLVIFGSSLLGCGGGSSIPPPRDSGSLTGVAHDAPLRNAPLRIYSWDTGAKGDLLAETTTDYNGDYTISIKSPNRPVLVEAGNGGTYTEEASGKNVTLVDGQTLSAVTFYESGQNFDVQVTAFTHLARCYAEYAIAQENEFVQDALNIGNSKIAGIAGVEIIQTKPLDVTDLNNANIELSPGLKYGFLTAAISQVMVEVSEANGLPAHSQTFLTSAHWSKIACNDIRADGLLDGVGYIDNNNTVGNLSFGTFPISPTVWRTLTAQKMLTFAASANNNSGLPLQDVLTFANALSTNTDAVWAGTTGEPVDAEGPTIAPLTPASSYIGGVIDLSFDINDPVGVKTIRYYVDNALLGTGDGNFTTFSLNTGIYTDGTHTVKVEAEDEIGNLSAFEIIYEINNSGPTVNLTSATVVGSTSYAATGTWFSPGPAIQSITVNGTVAAVNGDGTWSANISLGSGNNTVVVIATDIVPNQNTTEYNVGVDLNPPLYTHVTTSIRETTFEGQYNLCNLNSLTITTSTPICVRTDRVSLNGTSINNSLDNLEFVYIDIIVQDSIGAGVFSNFDDLIVEYKYENNGALVVDWTALTTGVKNPTPGAELGNYYLPLTTEFLGDDWFNTSTIDTHKITIKLSDAVGNSVQEDYNLKFDILLYAPDVSGTSNAVSIMTQPFASRTTIDGSSVTSKAIITNSSGSTIYINPGFSNNHSVKQIYESVIRQNRMAVETTEHWRLSGNTPVDFMYEWVGAWQRVDAPVILSSYQNVFQDVVDNPLDTDWFINPDYPCLPNSGFKLTIPGISGASWWNYVNKTAIDNGTRYGCVTSGTTVNAFYKRETYINVYEAGYPKTTVNTVTLSHPVNNVSEVVYNISLSSNAVFENGYYLVPAGDTVEVRKTITLPLIPDFNDTEVADLTSFGSYQQKDLDKEITWTLDETIDLEIVAAIGASALNQTIGELNTYIIAR